jgi:hypothetical protein
MTDIKEIEKLYAKVKTYKIPKKPKKGQKQATIEVTPIDLDNAGIMDLKENASMKEIAEVSKKFIAVSLGISEEAAGRIVVGHVEEIIEAITDANDFDVKDMKKVNKIRDFMTKKQALMKEQASQKEEKKEDDKPSGTA